MYVTRDVTRLFSVIFCVQVCDIGDASKGSLSSYAYILMLLHYLQQCKPPVIPVLQSLHTDTKPPEKVVDGWNCWFLSDPKKIVSGRALVIHWCRAVFSIKVSRNSFQQLDFDGSL